MRNLGELLSEAINEAQEDKIQVLPPFEDIDNSSDSSMTTLYRVAFSDQLDSIFKNGYSRDFTASKGGNLYGPGVYCTFVLSDSIHNVRTKPEYGNCIVKMRLVGGFKNFIIFSEGLARSVYGDKWTIKDQLHYMAGFDEETSARIENECRQHGSLYHGRTAGGAVHLWKSYRASLFLKHGVRGLIYKGNRDGRCALPYDFSTVIPYAVSFDQGRTFKKRFNKELYTNILDHPDTQFRYGGEYQTVFKAIKGYTMVKDGEEKYNVVSGKTHKPISPVWFTDIVSTISPENGTFTFTYQGIEFDGSIYAPPGENCDGCVLDPYGNPYCEFADLDGLVNEIKSSGATTFLEYAEMDDEQEIDVEDGNGMEESVRRIVDSAVRRVLFEDRTVDGNGVVTIDNFDDIARMMNPDSDDDVWFVQIIKRHKDNMHQHFEHNACDYIAYYLLHNADELMAKRDEIVHTCKATNSRAYIHLNKRSLVNLTDYANHVLRPRFERHHNRYRKGHEMEIAAGQPKDWPERKLCFLDVDSDDERVYRKVMDILSRNGITPVWEYRSLNNGWHILLPDKDQARNIDFSVIDNGQKFGRFSTVGLELDRPVLLYASLKPNGYGLQRSVQRRRSHGRR